MGQARLALDPQGPEPLRRRIDTGQAEAAPRWVAAGPFDPAARAAPSSPLPSLREELSLASLRTTAPGGSARSMRGPDDLPSLGSLLDADRRWPSVSLGASVATSSAEPRGPWSPDSSESDGVGRLVEPAPAKDVEDIKVLIGMLGDVAEGKKISHLWAGGVSFANAFEKDGRLKPRGSRANLHLRQVHDKLDRLRAGTPADRAVLHELKRATLRVGRLDRQRTAETLDSLMEASRRLRAGLVSTKQDIEDEFRGGDRPYMAGIVHNNLLSSGVVKGPEHRGTHVNALSEKIERLRKSGEHQNVLAAWDAFEAGQAEARSAAARSQRPRGNTARAVNVERRAQLFAQLKSLLDAMAQGEAKLTPLGGRAATSRFKSLFDFEGGFRPGTQDLLQPLHESTPAHRQLAEDVERSSIEAIQANRDREARVLRELADAVMDIKSGRSNKQDATNSLGLLESKAKSILITAIDRDGFLQETAASRKHAATLQGVIERLRGSGDPAHRAAAAAAHNALHHGRRPMPPPAGRPVRPPGARPTVERGARRPAQTSVPSGSVGSFDPRAPGPASLAPSGARSGTGAGFEAGEEVQSHRLQARRSGRFEVPDPNVVAPLSPTSLADLPPASQHGATQQPQTPSFELSPLREGHAPSLTPSVSLRPAIDLNQPSDSEPDFDALPALSGGQLELPPASQHGAAQRPQTPSFELSPLREGHAPSLTPSVSLRPAIDLNQPSDSEPDFDALPTLSGGQFSWHSERASEAPLASGRGLDPDSTAVQRANATRDWVDGMVSSWPAAYRRALVAQAVDIERLLASRHAPPLSAMLLNNNPGLLSLVTPAQADTIRQLQEILRPDAG